MEHAVIVKFRYGSTDLSALFAFEEKLEKAISAAAVGEFDGDEVAADGSHGSLYMYGPDADALFRAVRSVLISTRIIRNVSVMLRYGPAQDRNAKVQTFSLSDH